MTLMINGKPAEKGQEVETFRGEKGILVGWKEPAHSSSSGRVYVQLEGHDFQNEWYPGVIRAEWRRD